MNYKNKKKAKIRYIGFLLFFISNLFLLIISFTKINESNKIFFVILFYFILMFLFFSTKQKKFKLILFIGLFFGFSMATKLILLVIRLKVYNLYNIICLINYKYYLRLLNSFLFSFSIISLLNEMNIQKNIKLLFIPQLLVSNIKIDKIKINKNEIKKIKISKFIAKIIYNAYNDYNKYYNQ